MDCIAQVEVRGEFDDVGGVSIHFVAVIRFGRAAVAAPIVRDHTKPLVQEEQHLVVPVV